MERVHGGEQGVAGEKKNAAVPQAMALAQQGRGAGRIGLLDELGDVIGFERAREGQFAAGPDIAEAGLGTVGGNSERHEFSRPGAGHGEAHRIDQYLGPAEMMIGRHDQQAGIAGNGFGGKRRQCNSRRGVAGGRFEDDRRFQPREFGQDRRLVGSSRHDERSGETG
jgi:hypothetical protein